MKLIIKNYDQYFRFIDEYLTGGFTNIDRSNPLILNLEKTTETNGQFFCMFDLIQLKFLFTSRRSFEMTGILPAEITPLSFYKLMHPDDLIWNNIVQTRLFSLGQRLFIESNGSSLVSTNFRMKNALDEYMNNLVQSYLFFTEVPYKTVFILQVFTDISWYMNNKPGYHFYSGNDPRFFRYPDKKLLSAGSIFAL
jgi:hypothetical protein